MLIAEIKMHGASGQPVLLIDELSSYKELQQSSIVSGRNIHNVSTR
jgi:hypothetical protein